MIQQASPSLRESSSSQVKELTLRRFPSSCQYLAEEEGVVQPAVLCARCSFSAATCWLQVLTLFFRIRV